MSRKAVALASTIVLLALLAFSTVAIQAEESPLEILLSRNCVTDPEEPANSCLYEAAEGETVVLHGRWGACTPGLVKAYIRASQTTVTLDGEPLLSPEQIDELWGPIEVHGTSEACLMGDTVYISHWYYELTLPARTESYMIHTMFFLDHPLHDGGDYDGDGRPDVFDGLFHETDNELLIYQP